MKSIVSFERMSLLLYLTISIQPVDVISWYLREIQANYSGIIGACTTFSKALHRHSHLFHFSVHHQLFVEALRTMEDFKVSSKSGTVCERFG